MGLILRVEGGRVKMRERGKEWKMRGAFRWPTTTAGLLRTPMGSLPAPKAPHTGIFFISSLSLFIKRSKGNFQCFLPISGIYLREDDVSCQVSSRLWRWNGQDGSSPIVIEIASATNHCEKEVTQLLSVSSLFFSATIPQGSSINLPHSIAHFEWDISRFKAPLFPPISVVFINTRWLLNSRKQSETFLILKLWKLSLSFTLNNWWVRALKSPQSRRLLRLIDSISPVLARLTFQ